MNSLIENYSKNYISGVSVLYMCETAELRKDSVVYSWTSGCRNDSFQLGYTCLKGKYTRFEFTPDE